MSAPPMLIPSPGRSETTVRVFPDEWKQPLNLSEIQSLVKTRDLSLEYRIIRTLTEDDRMEARFYRDAETTGKNRYKNILPFSDKRVILDGGNYINASHVTGGWIASQGPLKTTCDDHWTMVWQENVRVILTIGKLQEGETEKIFQYWPTSADVDGMEFDHFRVECKSEKIWDNGGFVKRVLSLTPVATGEAAREVTHYHFTAWPDHGSVAVSDLIDLVAILKQERKNAGSESPILVHCSAGVGRTGTVLAAANIVQDIEHQLGNTVNGSRREFEVSRVKVSLMQHVLNLRECRTLMVERTWQYESLYAAVAEMVQRFIESESVSFFTAWFPMTNNSLLAIFAVVISTLSLETSSLVSFHSAADVVHESPFKNQTVLHGGALEIEDNNLERWADSDRIEVYLAEYHLQHVGLSSWLGFSTAHMAVVFQNARIRKWYVMDSFARSSETVANVIMPSISPDSEINRYSFLQRLSAYWRGDLVDQLTWDNAGYVRIREDKTDEFQDMQHIGTTTGLVVKGLREWIVEEYTRRTPFTFDMWQLYDGATNRRMRRSRMCHDFIEDVLGRIEWTDIASSQDETVSVFRDSLNLNVTHWEEVDMKDQKTRRDYQRFLRFFRNHVYEATRDLRYSRVTLSKLVTLGIPFILFLDGDKYLKLTLSEYSVINYCRMPMDFVKGKPYVAAKLDDDRQECFMDAFNVGDVIPNVRFTLSDFLIWAEQRLDDALFGNEGLIGDQGGWSYGVWIVETTVVLVMIARAAKWATRWLRKDKGAWNLF